MKKIYLLLVLNSLLISFYAQKFDWAKREGLWAYDYGYGITTDDMGNIYVAGKYELNADFSGTVLSCEGNHDSYVAQYSPAGTLNWVRTAGAKDGDYAHAISYDGSNYIYVAGEIEGFGNTILFENSAITLSCSGDNNSFLAKYDLSGNLVWARSAGGTNNKALAVTNDNSGNIYMAGYFNDVATFGSTPVTINSAGGNDIYISKYDKNGNFQWVRHAGGGGRDEAKSIKCDAAGNVYVCGMYSDGTIFGSTLLTTPNTPTGHYFNTFLAKYASDGTLNWVKTCGGDYDDVAWSLTLDNAGKIYITGEFNAYANFGGVYLTTAGQAQAFVACYDGTGTVQWATPAGCKTAMGAMVARARGIGCDGTNLYITGQFGGAAAFGSFNLTAADSSDIFMAKLNNSGTFVWALSVSGSADSIETLGYESGNTICAEASGNVYATGSLLDGGVFGSTSLLPYDRTDIFITKIIPGIVSVEEIDLQKAVSIYPNPGTGNFTVKFSQIGDQEIEITISDCLSQVIEKRKGRSSSEIKIDLSDRQKGIYFLELLCEDQTTLMKKIIIQ